MFFSSCARVCFNGPLCAGLGPHTLWAISTLSFHVWEVCTSFSYHKYSSISSYPHLSPPPLPSFFTHQTDAHTNAHFHTSPCTHVCYTHTPCMAPTFNTHHSSFSPHTCTHAHIPLSPHIHISFSPLTHTCTCRLMLQCGSLLRVSTMDWRPMGLPSCDRWVRLSLEWPPVSGGRSLWWETCLNWGSSAQHAHLEIQWVYWVHRDIYRIARNVCHPKILRAVKRPTADNIYHTFNC